MFPYGSYEHDILHTHYVRLIEAKGCFPLAQSSYGRDNPGVHGVLSCKEELIIRAWWPHRHQGQLAKRSESPVCGKMKNRLPFIIRQVVFFKFSGEACSINGE